MKLLALIPARGGSKRVPGKNIKPLGGMPLIAWSIRAARESAVFVDVMVTTDDPEVAEVARCHGAYVPWLRPPELATDTAGSAEVIRHAVGWYEVEHGDLDAVMLLQPTSPFRRVSSIRQATTLFAEQEPGACRSVVSVSPAAQHPAWCFRIGEDGIEPFMGWDALQQRTQDLPPAFFLNGAIYIAPAAMARNTGKLLNPGTIPFVMDDLNEALDIDTLDDWRQAVVLERNYRLDQSK
jgi:CMP-N-acetylneuraminic acid synthetase